MSPVDLHHHGDRDAAPGLVDLAVNVRLPGPPDWLAAAIAATLGDLGAYPDPRAATAALAARHGVDADAVLPTSGAAEAFTLVARGLGVRRPLVVHPSFTEPDAALAAAGTPAARHVLEAASGFRLEIDRVDPDADLVVVGNPTNPTGVLHPASALRRLRCPGRVLLVDEAFMDAVPGQPETLIGTDLTGVLVLRSLTKTWGLAGLRAGYVVGDPALIERLRAVQPPWSVSTPALAATVACCSERAGRESDAAASETAAHREVLVAALTDLGLPPVGEPRAGFVLVDTSSIGPESLRPALAERGFAVRRGETFPGLGSTWLRLAVRTPAITAGLASALEEIQAGARA